MMDRQMIIGLIIFISALRICSQPMPQTYFEDSSGRLEYGFFVPEELDDSTRYPLVLFLHGWSNNYTVYLKWYNQQIQSTNPCFVYTPKTPTSWGDWSGWNDERLSEPISVAVEVLDSLTQVYPVDTNRLYVYGISMGGEGAFDLLHKMPGKFAAAMSVCGGGQAWWAPRIARTPFWMFHGGSDNVNPPDLTERVYDALEAVGAQKMRYTRYEGMGHSIEGVAQNEPSWDDWMFFFDKSDTIYPGPTGELQLTATVEDENIQLSWNYIRTAELKADVIWYYTIYNRDGVIATTEFDETACTISAVNDTDTFTVVATNYGFQESAPSNPYVYKKEGTHARGFGSQKSSPMSLTRSANKLIVRAGETNAFNSSATVELLSLNGKQLLKQSLGGEQRVTVDIAGLGVGSFIVRVSDRGEQMVRRITINGQ